MDDWTTADLSASWSTPDEGGSWWSRGVQVALSVTNLTDEDPPVVINTLSGNQGAYDNVNHSALGRVVAVEVAKRW